MTFPKYLPVCIFIPNPPSGKNSGIYFCIIKPLIMKKATLLAMGSLLILAFESCSKDMPSTNNSKKAAVKQDQSTATQPQAPAQPVPPSSCPHASKSGSAG